jgi:pimeloyl-ACP methyl ester carboxylesterase
VTIAIDEGVGRAVLLVHGQPGRGLDWQGLARRLSTDLRVVATDRPGWGEDQRPATSIAANAGDLASVIESLGLPSPVTAVGHSLGGGIAIELALSRPDLVGSLVLLGSIGVERALSRFDQLLAVPRLGDPVIRAGVLATRGGIRTARRVLGSGPAKPLGRRVARWPTVRGLVWLDTQPISEKVRKSFLAEQRALLDETPLLERRLSLLDVPTAVVHGTADRVVPLSASRALAERIPGAELITLTGEGHLVPFERPGLIAPIVRRYDSLGARHAG